jgi:hypothetical protein
MEALIPSLTGYAAAHAPVPPPNLEQKVMV